MLFFTDNPSLLKILTASEVMEILLVFYAEVLDITVSLSMLMVSCLIKLKHSKYQTWATCFCPYKY